MGCTPRNVIREPYRSTVLRICKRFMSKRRKVYAVIDHRNGYGTR